MFESPRTKCIYNLGKLVVAALENPQLSGNTYFAASPERLNGEELAEAFNKGLGRTITFEVMEPKEFGIILNEAFGPGAGDAVAKDYKRYHDQPETRSFWEPVSGFRSTSYLSWE